MGDIVRVSPRNIFEMKKWGTNSTRSIFSGRRRAVWRISKVHHTYNSIVYSNHHFRNPSSLHILRVQRWESTTNKYIYILRKGLCGNNAGKRDKVIKDLLLHGSGLQ